jgi:hypothetical protein
VAQDRFLFSRESENGQADSLSVVYINEIEKKRKRKNNKLKAGTEQWI